MSNEWSWIDFIIHSLAVWFLLLGTVVVGPILVYKSIRHGKTSGWLQKKSESSLFSHDTPLAILLVSLASMVGVFYAYFVNGIFFKYWNRVLLFLGI